MEAEILSERVEREVRRVAAAFGVQEWATWEKSERELRYAIAPTIIYSAIVPSGEPIRFEMELNFAAFYLQIGEEEEDLSATRLDARSGNGSGGMSMTLECPHRNHILARGIYCLGGMCCGFNVGSFAQLNQMINDLSSHEKMELRFAMPREFWPDMWFDEEANLKEGL